MSKLDLQEDMKGPEWTFIADCQIHQIKYPEW